MHTTTKCVSFVDLPDISRVQIRLVSSSPSLRPPPRTQHLLSPRTNTPPSLQKQHHDLEEQSWSLNAQYSAQIENEVEKAAASSPTSAGSKKKKKAAANDPAVLQAIEDEKKLKEIAALMDKEKVDWDGNGQKFSE